MTKTTATGLDEGFRDLSRGYASTKSMDEAEAAGEAPVKIQLLEVRSVSVRSLVAVHYGSGTVKV